MGAQIGQYSLFAAAMNRKVVTVEPFHDNILRIHKAAYNKSLDKNSWMEWPMDIIWKKQDLTNF